MKRIITTIITLLTVLTMNAQSVYCVINMKTINKQVHYTKCIPLYEEGGYVIIPNTMYKHHGSLGLLVFHDEFSDNYFAYDLKCPECAAHNRTSKIFMETCILCRCSKCYAQFQNVCQGSVQETNLNGENDLTSYIVYKQGNKLIITDQIIQEYLF